MKKLGKIIFVCFLCIGIIKGNEGTLQAVNDKIFTADIVIGDQLVVTTFKVLSEESASTKGTVQIGDGMNTAIDRNAAGDMTIPEVVIDSDTGNSYDVTTIGKYAFGGCTSLKSTGLESNTSVTKIGFSSFEGCTSLESTGLDRNTSVTEIWDGAFRDCTSLKSTGLESNNTVTEISNNTFFGCTSLKNTGLESNNTVTEIGVNAFSNCTSLTRTGLESNNTITKIGDNTFQGCTSLKSTGLESNSSVTEIWGGAFQGCRSLTSTGLESNKSVTEIGYDAFSGCTSLTSTGLSADSKVTDIGRHAFYGCTKLASFIFKNKSIPTINATTFPSDIETYYFEGAEDTGNLSNYDSTEIKVASIKVVDETYHEGETFIPNGLKFRIGYSKTSETAEEVFDIVDYNNSKNEFEVNEVTLKSGINKIDVEYLNEQVTLTLDVEAHTYELKNDETNHWLQCTKDQAIKDKENHTYGEWIIDKEATLSEDGEKHTLCSICNNKKTERIPMLSDESSYAITSGSNQTWQKGSKNMVSFTIDAKVENFEGIKIDGKTINKELYTVKSGSTIIELKTEYLNTLNKGNYEIVFVFKGNEVATSFEVIETAVIDNKIPDTGDQTNISLYIGMVILALGGCIWFKVRS